MDISVTTPALLFPAISLLLLAYTNRFLALSNIVRMLSKSYDSGEDHNVIKQIDNLTKRISYIKTTQILGISSLLVCCISMFFLYAQMQLIGEILFGFSIILMALSLAYALKEMTLSGIALKLELEHIRQHKENKKSKK